MHGLARAHGLTELLLGTRGGPRAALVAVSIRLAAGTIFLVFGLYKFIDHAHEAASFEDYGLPGPGAFAYAIGVVEIVSGLLLMAGLGTRPAALVLAGDMVGAIVTAGRVEGGAINLGLAPALLVAMLALLWIGPGRWSADGGVRRYVTTSTTSPSASTCSRPTR